MEDAKKLHEEDRKVLAWSDSEDDKELRDSER
jgi:hypothetical protein